MDIYLISLFVLLILLPFLANYYEQNKAKIQRKLNQGEDFVFWLKDDFFTKTGFECLNCDEKNRAGKNLIIFTLIFIILSIIICVAFNIYRDSFDPWFFNFLCALIVIILIMIYVMFTIDYRIYPTINNYEKIIQYPQSENFSELEDHVGIIFSHCNKPRDNIFQNDAIALLIAEFRKSNTKYRIYNVFEPKHFIDDAYNNPKVRELWIFGHGDRGGVSFGNKGEVDYIDYSKLEKLDKPKQFIAQFHCNDGNGTSLQEKNECDGFVSQHMRMAFQNRCYIIKRFEK